MQKLLPFFLFACLSFAPGGQPAAYSQNQNEMTAEAQEEFEEAQREMNHTYNTLLKKLDASSKKELVNSQRIWLQYRDSNARARAAANQGGSVYPMIYAGSRAKTTRDRTADLLLWLAEYK